jgi:hypothetical protein
MFASRNVNRDTKRFSFLKSNKLLYFAIDFTKLVFNGIGGSHP